MLAKIACATALGLSLLASGAARGDGGGGGSDRQSCPGGYVYDARTNSCVKQQAGVLPDQELTDYAFALIKTGRYGEAIGVLDILENPNTAVALNYRGYATRKLYDAYYNHKPVVEEEVEEEADFAKLAMKKLIPKAVKDQYQEYTTGSRVLQDPGNLFHWWAGQTNISTMQQMAFIYS